MSQFKYNLPSGANFAMQAPADTTQTQADFIFYSQVASGALVGFEPGQSITGTTSAAVKFELSRLDRGTAGVDDVVILSIINGLPTVTNIPPLLDVALDNPVTQADIAEIGQTGFTAPAIGNLTGDQTQAIMAQISNTVDQPATVITNDKGVGRYGLSCQQLEQAGYVKPGTWQQFIQNGNSDLTAVLSAPGIWTGRQGIRSATDFLFSLDAQNTAQATLMTTGYSSLQAAGVITTPASQAISAVRGVVFTGGASPLTAVTSAVTNSVNSQVGSLVANASKFGTSLTAQWAQGLPSISNLTSIKGIGSLPGLSSLPSLGSLTSGITPNLASVQSAMNSLGKASQFATSAASNLTGALGNVGNLSLSSLTGSLPSVSGLTSQLTGKATALAGQLQGQASALLGQAQGLAGNFANINVSGLLGGTGDSLVANVQKAAGFSGTVNRATVDVAMVKVFGSSKIPVPSLGANLPDSSSIAAALDIGQAQTILKDIKGQGSRLLGGVQNAIGSSLGGITAQVTALSGSAQQQATTLARSATTVFNPAAGTVI
jgi:hypothetical protein